MTRYSVALAVVLVFVLAISAYAQGGKKPAAGKAMQYGLCVAHSLTFTKPPNKDDGGGTWRGAITRSLCVALPENATLAYDLERLTVCGFWSDGFLNFANTHHTSYKGSLPPQPSGNILYADFDSPGWTASGKAVPASELQFLGHYLHGRDVVLAYRVAGREVLELPSGSAGKQFGRTFRIGPGAAVSLRLVGPPDEIVKPTDASPLTAVVSSAKGVTLRRGGSTFFVDIAASEEPIGFAAWFGTGSADELATLANRPLVDPLALTKGGASLWPEVQYTQGIRAADSAAYVLDDLTVPVEPFGSWMRLSGIDAFPEGNRLAVSTLSGDVWIVSWENEDLSKIAWRRFATGLYEPLGLRIVGGKIYIRGRDRITRLHDLNGDGEADWYESFHSAGPIGAGYHAFLFDLVTDKAGNFYYANSGRKAPTNGEVMRVSPDGRKHEAIGGGFRHPNGLGSGGPRDWILAADNPEGKYPNGASIILPGSLHGYNTVRTVPLLYVLPPQIDTSSGSQIWSDATRFGPLSGKLFHLSYSVATLSYVHVQDFGVENVLDRHPNGFAVKMPFAFPSGLLRATVRPQDGQLYLVGQRGWDSNAARDGLLMRVRYTGKPAYLLTSAAAVKEGLKLTFSCPLDPATVSDDNFSAERVGEKAAREVEIDEVELLDERTVLVKVPGIDPSAVLDEAARKQKKSPVPLYRVVDPLAIQFQLRAKDGTAIKDTVYATVNAL